MGAEEEEETTVGREGGGCGGEGEVEGDYGAADKGESAAAVVSCSICLEAVVAGGEGRSTAKLQCGHEFHLVQGKFIAISWIDNVH